MQRINPREMYRTAGTPNKVVLLADRSTSMSLEALRKTDEVVPQFRAAIPNLRVFGFHADLLEVDYGKIALTAVRPERGRHKSGGGYCNSTYLGLCLEKIAKLKPEKTIVISDGGIADARRALNAADRMTGDIDAYFCPSMWQDKSFMEELARRGRGRFLCFDPHQHDLAREYRRSMKVLLGSEIRVERRDEWRVEGEPVRQRIVAGGTLTASAGDIASRFRK